MLGAHLGKIDMEITNGVGAELAPLRLVAVDLWQPGDIVPLEAAMQRRAGQVRDRGLQSIEAIIQRQ